MFLYFSDLLDIVQREKTVSDLKKELEAHREKEEKMVSDLKKELEALYLMKQVSTLVPARFLKCLDV